MTIDEIIKKICEYDKQLDSSRRNLEEYINMIKAGLTCPACGMILDVYSDIDANKHYFHCSRCGFNSGHSHSISLMLSRYQKIKKALEKSSD